MATDEDYAAPPPQPGTPQTIAVHPAPSAAMQSGGVTVPRWVVNPADDYRARPAGTPLPSSAPGVTSPAPAPFAQFSVTGVTGAATLPGWSAPPTTTSATPQPDPAVGDRVAYDEPMLQWFEFTHLPEHLRPYSIPFWELACTLCATLPRNPERSVALRKLLEAKDAGVRARLYREPAQSARTS